MNKTNELCVLLEPWKIHSSLLRHIEQPDGGILMALTCAWSSEDECYHLTGKVYLDSGDHHDEQITTSIPSGNNILLPGEFFIDCSGPFRFWYEYLIEKGILSHSGKTFRADHVEYTACQFHKDKCASRFKCDQCGSVVSSSQAYYDEKTGGTRCTKCEAILSGDFNPADSFEKDTKHLIDGLDKLDF